jgi:hypothetical protein
MLDKRNRGMAWIAVVLLENFLFLGYLMTYTGGGGEGRFIGILPEAFVTLTVLVFGITIVNAILGWWYLGKPDISEVFRTGEPTHGESEVSD